jgi:hypothetical protein
MGSAYRLDRPQMRDLLVGEAVRAEHLVGVFAD